MLLVVEIHVARNAKEWQQQNARVKMEKPSNRTLHSVTAIVGIHQHKVVSLKMQENAEPR